jgi:hypothetical protein
MSAPNYTPQNIQAVADHHRNDVPGVDGLTNHQLWAVRRIAAETLQPDYSGYVRTDCARCGPDTSNCTCPEAVFCGVVPAPARHTVSREDMLSVSQAEAEARGWV